MKPSFLLGITLVGLWAGVGSATDLEFETVPGDKTGLKAALETWYDVEMMRQGGPGKQSHGWWPWGLRACDFDNDGALDLVASHHGVPRSIVLKSRFKETGKLHFANVTADLGLDHRDLPGADDRPWIWDFDGDGWLDIAGFSDESPAVSAWNVGGKKFVSTGKPFFSPLSHPREIVDLNGDGYLDVDGGAKGQWFYVPATRTFQRDPKPRFDLPAGVPPDLVEALAIHKKSNRFFSLEYWTHAVLGYDTLGYDPRPIDLDGDGRNDVVVHGSGGYGAVYLGRYLLRTADDRLIERTKELGLPAAGAPILIDDLTGDGRPEILIAGEKDSGLYLNDGAGKFTRADGKLTAFLTRRGPYLLRAYRTDLDNDGRPDLVLSNPRLGLAGVFQNRGNGDFTQTLALGGCWDNNPIVIADLDNDGRTDLAIGGSANPAVRAKEITIYLNRTKDAGNFIKIAPRMPAPNPFAVGAVVEVFRAGDLDRKGALPILVEKAHSDATPVHAGLGQGGTCDLRVTFPGGKVVTASGVAANTRVTVDRETAKVKSKK
jgi:hypothetical protein